MTSVSFDLVDTSGSVIASGTMPWFYVQPRIIEYNGDTYVMLSDIISPGPTAPHRYILVKSTGVYHASSLNIP